MKLTKYLTACVFSVLTVNVYAITVVDDTGNTVTLEKPAKRIIALAPHIVEMTFAVGAGNNLVGVVSHSDFPEAAQALPRVGTYKDFSIESILRLKPDLILAWYSGNGSARVEQLRVLGIPIYYSEPRKLEDIGSAMERIGLLAGSAQAAQAQQDFSHSLAELRQRYGNKEEVSVFYQVWNNPLQTLNGKHMVSDVMALCGGRNVFHNSPALAPKISVEAVLRTDPQVISASGMGEARPEWLDEWQQWPQLQAVAGKQLYFIPPDLIQRHTPRLLEGARLMCEQLDQARTYYSDLSLATKP